MGDEFIHWKPEQAEQSCGSEFDSISESSDPVLSTTLLVRAPPTFSEIRYELPDRRTKTIVQGLLDGDPESQGKLSLFDIGRIIPPSSYEVNSAISDALKTFLQTGDHGNLAIQLEDYRVEEELRDDERDRMMKRRLALEEAETLGKKICRRMIALGPLSADALDTSGRAKTLQLIKSGFGNRSLLDTYFEAEESPAANHLLKVTTHTHSYEDDEEEEDSQTDPVWLSEKKAQAALALLRMDSEEIGEFQPFVRSSDMLKTEATLGRRAQRIELSQLLVTGEEEWYPGYLTTVVIQLYEASEDGPTLRRVHGEDDPLRDQSSEQSEDSGSTGDLSGVVEL
ncbi:uncharacterized protein MKK02DRAFT_42383 [Dioszegia hungarica]|uniref:Uncharacterized protein n=1 Tax=Dioszegia hungarica TaxID=4972 RepID=A0AA38HCR9_9TREE|nr:uncharacterized protein MKK02DRAFT_42383 [Dioszegia hungarica]KAI9638000.1 hypothetical protein MKK02DRAFT_42383 [Dioszegia hungarica]